MKVLLFLTSLFFVIFLSFTALNEYSGNSYVFILFSLSANFLLYYSFRKNALFFDTFLATFLWLGIWLKATIRIAYLDSKFSEGLGAFTITNDVFDKSLLIASFSFIVLSLASYVREKFFYYKYEHFSDKSSLLWFYKKYRLFIISFYILLFIFIALSNFYLGIYQRGEITQTYLPYGLNGVYKWLLLFGIASFASIILRYEIELNKKTIYFVPILVLVESAVTNISLLSRGMILNSSSLGYGVLKLLELKKIKFKKLFWFILGISFVILFIFSVVTVNKIRESNIKNVSSLDYNIDKSLTGVKILFLDRWVGIEGIIAVVASEKKNWNFFQEALKEKYDENKTSFYDLELINSPYLNTDMTKNHHISLPGYIAFFYYSGSLVFLLSSLFILSMLASALEIISFKLSNQNLIFSSLIGQVIAYRFTHFGYVPAQSYLLFGAIILNILIIYVGYKIINKMNFNK